MSTTPIPSALVEDFRLNVEDFDAFANGTGTYTDRFGSSRLSLSQFMESIGYEVPVAFADALSITRVTQTVTYSGNTYHARADAIPFTTTVTFNAAQWDLLVSNPVEVSTHAAASKATPVDADEVPLVDSEASFGLKRLTWSNLKSGVFSAWGTLINSGASKATPVDTDALAIMDSEAGNATKKLTLADLKSALVSYFFEGGNLTGPINANKGSDIASAATVDLGAATGEYVTVTGTTTITSFGSAQSGTMREVHFSGALTITHNATSLILPTGSDINTAAGDVFCFRSEGGSNWRCVSYVSNTTNKRTAFIGTVSASGIQNVDFTPALSRGIPTWAKKIRVVTHGLSSNGTASISLRVGVAGSFVATGYVGYGCIMGGSALSGSNPTAQFALVSTPTAASTYGGGPTLSLSSGNTWAISSILGAGSASSGGALCAGYVDAAGSLDSLRIFTTDTFDGGTISVYAEN